MNKKLFNKILLSVILMFSLMLVSSCSIIKNLKKSIVNEIRNEYVEYEQNITVEDIEDALEVGTEIAKSCTVGVKVESKNFITTSSSTGSAVIVKKESHGDDTYTYTAITNRHVTGVNSSTTRQVYLGNNIFVNAVLVAYDKEYDLALIQFTTGILLNVAKIYTDEVKVGSFAIAVGSPYDLQGFFNTVTLGIISATHRQYRDEDVNGNEIVNEFIQHDAAINSGNSGGGLFDIYGRLIGINTWKIASDLSDDYEGLNFAIPSKEIVNRFSKYL